MKRFFAVVLCITFMVVPVFAMGSKDSGAKNGGSDTVKSMTGDELVKQNSGQEKDKILIIDVRPVEQYKAGHIPNAINILSDDIAKNVERIAEWKNKPVITYCNTGNRSGKAAKALVAAGFTDVSNAAGVKQFEYNLVTYTDIYSDQLIEMAKAKDVILIDYRPVEHYTAGHLEGAINIPWDQIDANLSKLSKDKKVVIYCNTGTMSSKGAKELSDKGFDVYNSIIGIKEHKYELVK